MKNAYVRIYSEDELRRKVQRTLAKLKELRQKIEETPDFCDIEALTDMWVQYEKARFVVKGTLSTEDRRGYGYDPFNLYVQQEVEDDYSDELKDPDSLHNSLVYLQIMFNSFQSFLLQSRNIDLSQYMDNEFLVLNLATDLLRHLNLSKRNEYNAFFYFLYKLNDYYFDEPEWNIVDFEDVRSYDRVLLMKEGEALTYLAKTLSLEPE